MAAELSCDVLVVGAGPTGLMLANWLVRLGVRVIVVDGKDGPTRESRALVLQARSIEVYDQLGLAGPVLEAAHRAEALAPGFGSRVFGRIPLGALGEGVTPYPWIEVLEQSRNEQILYANLRALGGDVRWGAAVTALTATPEHVEAVTAEATITARFCVGADGANSVVRKSRGIAFDGVTNPHTFYVIDATAVGGLVDRAINVRPGKDDFLLGFPMRGSGNWRLIGLVRDSDGDADGNRDGDADGNRDGNRDGDADGNRDGDSDGDGDGDGDRDRDGKRDRDRDRDRDGKRDRDGDRDRDGGLAEADARARMRRDFAVTYAEARWFATYRVHHRVAAVFRDGPFFLAGDAAHVHSPVGGQGMNTGLQDAHNLAFKLADAVHGRAGDAWLDRYQAERRPVAETLVATTDRLFGFITSQKRTLRALRRAVIPLLAPVGVRALPRVRGASRLFEYVSQTRIRYHYTPDAPRHPVVGRRLRWAGDNFEVLRSLEWQIHAYGGVGKSDVPELGLPVHIFGPAPQTPLRPGRLYLVRPDGFVAAEAAPAEAAEVFRGALPR